MQHKLWYITVIISIFVIEVGTAVSAATDVQILTEEWPPISFSADGTIDGLGVEVVREVLKRLNWPDTIKVYPWARAWKMVNTEPNIILFTVTRTPEREKLVTLIGPVAIGTTNLYAKKGSGITLKSLEEAKRFQRIGVYRSAVEEQLLTEAGFCNLEATTIPLHTARKLMIGRIDLWCNANLTTGAILQEAGFTLDDVEVVYTIRENHLYIAFSRGTSDDIIQRWTDALRAIKQSGTFARIYEKWLPGETPPELTECIGLHCPD